MKKNNVSISVFILTSVLVLLSFNNCSGEMNQEEAEMAANALNSSSFSSSSVPRTSFTNATGQRGPQSSAPSTVGTSAGGPLPLGSNATCVGDAPPLKVWVAPSMSGPWVENGTACRGRASYFKLSGLQAGQAVRGCASPSSSKQCLNLENHRDYLASERVGADIITAITAADSSSWPVGSYDFYISLIGAKNINLVKVGSAKLADCAGTPAPAPAPAPVNPPFCYWEMTPSVPVIGGGRTVVNANCSTSNVGATSPGYYDMGSGNTMPGTYTCRCK